jgi:hypothetical protein
MPTYKDLLHYGQIIRDKNYQTTIGSAIRITKWDYENEIYITVKKDGYLITMSKESEVLKCQ